MQKSSIKLLLNAEPFGFGPTAAIATFFPTLYEQFETIAFAGKGHTLDLQRNLPYTQVHDITSNTAEEICTLLRQYNVVVTALDFEFATLAKSCGVTTIIYDPLTWYWPTIPEVTRTVDLYLAQDFYGVRERLQNDPTAFPSHVEIVPPIVSQKRQRGSEEHILINLGGLQNPFVADDILIAYAKKVLTEILRVTRGSNVIISGSQAIARALPEFPIESYKRDAMYTILEATTCAFMTPGLGNIYDTAKFNIPTVWLPPANDSQGQQLQILKQHNAVDALIDWSDLGYPVDYFAAQNSVLTAISAAITSFSNTTQFDTLLMNKLETVTRLRESATSTLLDTFGTGGAERVSELIIQFCAER
jgi:hypothetical protein